MSDQLVDRGVNGWDYWSEGSVTLVDLMQVIQLWGRTVVVIQGLPLCIGQAISALDYFKCISYFLLNCGGIGLCFSCSSRPSLSPSSFGCSHLCSASWWFCLYLLEGWQCLFPPPAFQGPYSALCDVGLRQFGINQATLYCWSQLGWTFACSNFSLSNDGSSQGWMLVQVQSLIPMPGFFLHCLIVISCSCWLQSSSGPGGVHHQALAWLSFPQEGSSVSLIVSP